MQLWSVRSNLEKDFVGTLEKIAEIGYKDLQVNSHEITPERMTFGKGVRAPELCKQLDRFGLRAASAHFIPTADMRLEAIAEDLKVLGTDTLAIAAWFWSNQKDVIEWNHKFNQYGEALKKLGIQLYYHNYFHEFQVFGDKSIYEMLMDDLDKDLVMYEFDTYWAVRGGQDPIYWLKKLGRRCDQIHQKDLPASTRPIILFEKFGYDAELNVDALWKTQDPSHFTEVGEGILNIPGYIQAARKYNQARYIFIEQDMTNKTEMDSIAVNFTKMNSLMAEN